MSNTLRVEHLSKYYGKKHVVKDISFSMHTGEIVGLLGPNGAGKTTSFYMIVGFIKANGGSIYLDDKLINDKTMEERSRMGIAYLPQEPSIFRKLTVEDNIKIVLEAQKLTKEERKEKLDELLKTFGIDRVRKQKGFTLSGGERRRTEIARALATNPLFLLLDEPFAGIDPKAVYEIKQIVKHLASLNIGVLITDHNVRDTLEVVTSSHIISQGEILISGTKEEVIENEKAREIYFGNDFGSD